MFRKRTPGRGVREVPWWLGRIDGVTGVSLPYCDGDVQMLVE